MSRSNLQKLPFMIFGILGIVAFSFHTQAASETKITPHNKVMKDCSDCPEMLIIPTGNFEMGSNSGEEDEKPVHRVTFSKSFAMSRTEITQGQWKSLMGSNPSYYQHCGNTCPVENVSWIDIQEYIKKLNSKTGKLYRLPSEAEWEYACRAGSQQEYCGSDNMDSVAWYGHNSLFDEAIPKQFESIVVTYEKDSVWYDRSRKAESHHVVALKQDNAFGLYDMSGNVWEFVEDSYNGGYSGAPIDGGAWLGDGAQRVLRGGAWNSSTHDVRAARRYAYTPERREEYVGFRLVRELP